MPSEEDALLSAIVSNPDDDAPRLVYADWLGERGDARGELIQLQIRAARLEPGGERNKVRAAENKLLEAHPEWTAPFHHPTHARRPQFTRGFVDAIQTFGHAFVADAPALFAAAPLLREIDFVINEPHDVAAADVPALDRLRSIVFGGPATALALPRLLARPLPNLVALAIKNANVESADLARLDRARFPNLRTLVFENAGFREDHAVALAHASIEIRSLTIAGNEFTASAGYDASIAALPAIPRATDVGASGAVAIARAPFAKTLTELRVPYARLGPDGAAALVSIPTLASIDLSRAAFGPGPWLEPVLAHPNLREVVLTDNGLGDDGAKMVAAAPGVAHWTNLHLGSNGISLDGITALAESPYVTNLRVLNLSNNGRLRDRAIEVLLASSSLANAKIWVRAGFLARKKIPVALERSAAKREAREKEKTARARKK